ncbi:hypothetical protein [Rhizobium phage RHEph12]|nr:hypothetical protein [Rhizobium phage RHEph12]
MDKGITIETLRKTIGGDLLMATLLKQATLQSPVVQQKRLSVYTNVFNLHESFYSVGLETWANEECDEKFHTIKAALNYFNQH